MQAEGTSNGIDAPAALVIRLSLCVISLVRADLRTHNGE